MIEILLDTKVERLGIQFVVLSGTLGLESRFGVYGVEPKPGQIVPTVGTTEWTIESIGPTGVAGTITLGVMPVVPNPQPMPGKEILLSFKVDGAGKTERISIAGGESFTYTAAAVVGGRLQFGIAG